MMKYVMLLIVATLAAAVFALADVVGKVDNTAQAQAGTPSNVSATNGANPGEAMVSWDPAAGASAHRVGWLAVPDYQANIDNDRWRERFAYSDVNASSSYTVTRLTPGIAYYFITGRKQGDDIAWSAWATLTLNGGTLPCSSQPAVAPSTTSALRVANGSSPGQVVVSWGVVAGTTGYRVGWLAVPDYQANLDGDRWRERFAYSDIGGGSSYTVARLTPGIAYYFILGRKQGDDITWSQWAALALGADTAACSDVGQTTDTTTITPTQTFPASAMGGDYDHDDDGLIEVRALAQLAVIRLDRSGNSRVDIDDLPEYLAAFPGALDDMGCPADGCNGYELAASLDFDTNGNGEADEGDAYWNDGAGWEPIVPSLNATFVGFEGNGYTIANLYINRPLAENVGLFGINYRNIRNVVLYGIDVTGGGSSNRPQYSGGVGGLVGYNSGDIRGSTVRGTVSGEYNVGVLAGNNAHHINNSSARGNVSGRENIGGLVGFNGVGTINFSTATGGVSGRANTGGLVGLNDGGTINDSSASGDVSGTGKVGGLVGSNAYYYVSSVRSAINRSTASGAVSGSYHIGGLVGDNAGAISDSAASGAVSGNHDRVGGLVGYNDGGTIDDSSASGNVSGNDEVGGLVGEDAGRAPSYYTEWRYGWNFGAINDSSASGTVTGNDHVGGLAGYNWLGSISASEAEGDATGRFYVGGLVGRNLGSAVDFSEGTVNLGTIADSTASGNVAGVRFRGALVGANDGGTISNSAGTGTVTTRQ